MTPRATVRLLTACDNACVFCGQHGIAQESPPRVAISAALARARVESDEVTLVGGEPALHPELLAIVAEARALGFRRIGLQTNGRSARVVEALVDAGLTDVHLSIHGAVAAAHDYHTGFEGSFVAAMAALSASRAQKLTVAVTTVLTRSNARGLGELARLLAARGVSAWCIAVPRARGRAAEAFDRVVPRLGVAIPFALHAMKVAREARLPVFIRGAPFCVLGPFARDALADAPRAYPSACNGCAARTRCPGVEAEYLARFAGDELSPAAAISPVESELARLFVGEGELAPSAARSVAEAPARARNALPMLGKVQPARAEVPRSVEKKSGPALREIFKELFVEEEPK